MGQWPTLRINKDVMVTDEIGLVAEEASSDGNFLASHSLHHPPNGSVCRWWSIDCFAGAA